MGVIIMKLSAVLTIVCATVLFSQHVESKPFLKNLFGGLFGGGKNGGSGGYGQMSSRGHSHMQMGGHGGGYGSMSSGGHGHMSMGGYGGSKKSGPDFGAIFSKVPQLIGKKVGLVGGIVSAKTGLLTRIPAKIGGIVGGIPAKFGGISGKFGGILGGGKKEVVEDMEDILWEEDIPVDMDHQ